ncbi:MAG TPA: LacI family DNA-binding transcriptional regulator, partial [Cellulomonas sp.]
MAALAGVSRSTASRAVNGGTKVSLGAQAAVDAAVDDLGYEPNRAARSLVTRRTDSIALVVPEPDEKVLTDPFFAGTLRGLGAALEHTEFQLVLLIARLEASRPLAARYLRRGHVDGAIVVS